MTTFDLLFDLGIIAVLLIIDRVSAARHRAYMRGEPWRW